MEEGGYGEEWSCEILHAVLQLGGVAFDGYVQILRRILSTARSFYESTHL